MPRIEQRYSWHEFYFGLAEYVATRSKDPSTKVGAVIVDNRHRISIGYNGFPMGIDDTDLLLNDRKSKYPRTIHAEMNAILKAGDTALGATLYCTMYPCATCAGAIIQAGITTVVSPTPGTIRWEASHKIARTMFAEANVQHIPMAHIKFFIDKAAQT